MYTMRIFLFCLGLFFTNRSLVASSSTSTDKVVFLRGNDIVTASGDGSGERILVHDDNAKSNPVWSPDGSSVAYAVSAESVDSPGKPIGNVVVLASDSSARHIVPVATEEPDGTMIDGMRFIESDGWYGENAIFASGSANPHVSEYRIMDINTGKVIGGYLGNDFATCAAKAEVAYISDENSGNRGPQVAVNGRAIYSGVVGSSLRDLHWSADCQRLAVFEDKESSTTLVVLNESRIEVKILLPAREWESGAIQSADNSFMLSHDSELILYDPSAKKLKSDPASLEHWKKKLADRAAVLQRLHGDKADWWPGMD